MVAENPLKQICRTCLRFWWKRATSCATCDFGRTPRVDRLRARQPANHTRMESRPSRMKVLEVSPIPHLVAHPYLTECPRTLATRDSRYPPPPAAHAPSGKDTYPAHPPTFPPRPLCDG